MPASKFRLDAFGDSKVVGGGLDPITFECQNFQFSIKSASHKAYRTTPSIGPYISSGHIAYRFGRGGASAYLTLEAIIVWSWDYLEQNFCLKYLIRWLRGKEGNG